MNIRNVEVGTSDFVSSLTSGYDRQGYVPVPKPIISEYRRPNYAEKNDNGDVPVPTPGPSSFPTGGYDEYNITTAITILVA